ncbi:alpha/beta fold hydrolase [Chloroflexota bacterium]
MKRAYIDIPEGQIHYQIEGRGEYLLLLHQGMFSSEEFTKIMPILGRYYQVIARDMLGYGKSDPNPPDYRIEDYARADLNFLNALGITRTSIVGVRTGAKIAVEIAVAYPKVVNKLVLCAMRPYSPEEREVRRKSLTYSSVGIEKDGSHFTSRLWRKVKEAAPQATPEVWNKVVIAAAMASGGAFHGARASFIYDLEKRLPLVKSPALLISKSENTLQSQLQMVSSSLPQCRVSTIEEASGFVALEKPQEFAEVILDFLKKPRI